MLWNFDSADQIGGKPLSFSNFLKRHSQKLISKRKIMIALATQIQKNVCEEISLCKNQNALRIDSA